MIGRHSIFTKTGRIFQMINPILFRILEIGFKHKRMKKYPIIAVIAPPRSGSTLTYQILANGVQSLYLTNLWNLFYAIPIIGGLLSKNKSSNVDFTSNRGWVNGLYGESEGMRFWDYWIGQSLEEPIKKVPKNRIAYIQKAFANLLDNRRPMITAYLGHAFCVDELRNIFPGITFVYLKRDKLSNIYSLFKINSKMDWFSLKPAGWKYKKSLNAHEKTIWQYNKIIQSIENSIHKDDTLIVNYEDVCLKPKEFLFNLREFVKNKGFDIKINLDKISSSYEVSKIRSNQNDDTKYLNKLLENER